MFSLACTILFHRPDIDLQYSGDLVPLNPVQGFFSGNLIILFICIKNLRIFYFIIYFIQFLLFLEWEN